MKYLYLFIFTLLVGCASSNKVYICGDHPCKNKKEVDEFFKNNISLEVYVVESKRSKKINQDLVELNLYKDKSANKKKEFDFLNKRKNINEMSKKDKKPKKIELKVNTTENESVKTVTKEKVDTKPKKTFFNKKNKSTKIVHLCKTIEECDIDLISKKVKDLGKTKSFPDLNY